MAAPPWMPWYVADYLADTRHLDDAEHGAYCLLLMHQWQHGSIPDDAKKLCRIACSHPKRWPKIWSVIGSFFVPLRPGLLVNKRGEKERSKAAEISSKRKAAALQMHSKRKADADAPQPSLLDGLQTHPHPQSQLQSQNQDPGPLHTQDARARPPSDADGTGSQNGLDDWPPDYREQFRDAYPHKVAMAAALPLLGGIRRERKVAWAVLIAAVAAYAGKTDDRQWANPATWLRGERWNDRPAPQPAGNGAHAKPATAGDRARRLARQMEARERDGTHQRPPDAIGGDELGGDDARLVSGAKRDG